MKCVSHQQAQQSGIALIIAMVSIAILAILAAGFALSMKVEMKLANNANVEPDLEWLGRSGMEKAKCFLSAQTRMANAGNYEALNQDWSTGFSTNAVLEGMTLDQETVEDGNFSVKIVDLERKFNINLVANDRTFMQQALNIVGLDASSSSTVIDSIADWIDRDDNARVNGAESDFYQTLQPPYYAKNGLLDDISELLLINGVTPEIYYGSEAVPSQFGSMGRLGPAAAQPRSRPIPSGFENPLTGVGLKELFTTISSGKLNINTATVNTLQVIPEIDATIASAIVQFRAGPDGVEGTEDDVPFRSITEVGSAGGITRQGVVTLSRYCDVRSHTFEVTVQVEKLGAKKTYIGILRRSGNVSDFQLVSFYWKN